MNSFHCFRNGVSSQCATKTMAKKMAKSMVGNSIPGCLSLVLGSVGLSEGPGRPDERPRGRGWCTGPHGEVPHGSAGVQGALPPIRLMPRPKHETERGVEHGAGQLLA